MKTIGNSIALYRNSRRWTQTYLASKAGLTQSQLSNIENDHTSPTWHMICKVAEQLEAPPGQLLPAGQQVVAQEAPQANGDSTAERRLWERLIEAKEAVIKAQEETIRVLRLACEEKEARP